jgi:hypothetical protein
VPISYRQQPYRRRKVASDRCSHSMSADWKATTRFPLRRVDHQPRFALASCPSLNRARNNLLLAKPNHKSASSGGSGGENSKQIRKEQWLSYSTCLLINRTCCTTSLADTMSAGDFITKRLATFLLLIDTGNKGADSRSCCSHDVGFWSRLPIPREMQSISTRSV